MSKSTFRFLGGKSVLFFTFTSDTPDTLHYYETAPFQEHKMLGIRIKSSPLEKSVPFVAVLAFVISLFCYIC